MAAAENEKYAPPRRHRDINKISSASGMVAGENQIGNISGERRVISIAKRVRSWRQSGV